MKLNFCGRVMLLPVQMDQPGTMLLDGKPCPTHQIVDAPRGYTVCMGEQFWGAALETISSCPVQENASTFSFSFLEWRFHPPQTMSSVD